MSETIFCKEAQQCEDMHRMRLRVEEAEARNKLLKEDLAEKQALFNLQHTRMLEAFALWQEETGKDCFPDLGELLRWLIEKAWQNNQLRESLRQAVLILETHMPPGGRSLDGREWKDGYLNEIKTHLNETDFANIKEEE